MTPVSPPPRRLLPACWLSAAVLALAGCGAVLPGAPGSAEQTTIGAPVGAELAALVPAPDAFPAGYPAVVLPAEAAAQAAADLDGVGPGATVEPARCAPPPELAGPAVAVGTDEESRSSLTVELSRTDQPLARLRTRLAECANVRVLRAGAAATVVTDLLDEAPDAAPAPDDALALLRTVSPDRGGAALTQTMRTVIGQVGDVRITVTGMVFGGSEPEPGPVDELFATAVERVRAG
ncbi:sensor domain-containing protein [Nocardia sp. NPDC057353]|uniref:sensor domain-containing protein n=1 Tax=Nocardia sp. NPDC057353 TaxID=3346104 RepID=UPI003630FE7F